MPNLTQPGRLRARDRVGDSERRAELAAVQEAGDRKADGGRYRRRLRHDVVRSGTVRGVGADASRREGGGHAGGSRKGNRRDARQPGRRGGIAEGQESRSRRNSSSDRTRSCARPRCSACTKCSATTTWSTSISTAIDKVTAADVQRVAKTYLVAANMTEGVLVPTGVLPHGGGGLSGGECTTLQRWARAPRWCDERRGDAIENCSRASRRFAALRLSRRRRRMRSISRR